MFTLVGLDDRENSHVCDTTLFLSLCLWMRKSELCFPWVSAAGLVLSRLSRGTFWSSEPPLWRWRSDPGQRERWGSCLHLGRAHVKEVCVCVLLAQSCPTLCNPVDCSPPGSSVRGIFQARLLEWVAMSSSRGSSQPRN